MYYFYFGDFYVVGASPEILVRLEGEIVTVRPIAGTRRRGATPAEDEALADELLGPRKERRAHHARRLGRNDVGRVAQTGTVRVTERMVIERYSHVMHIVSNVEGVLQPGLKRWTLLRATFPGRHGFGRAKVRAMEIIDELEPVKRGSTRAPWDTWGFHGNMDVAIALRTAVIKDGTLHVAGRRRHRR
jgi:anthranilate synthase component 1